MTFIQHKQKKKKLETTPTVIKSDSESRCSESENYL